ncbi:MAG: hypothetical protein LC687_01645 [Actinobacteria bacterium]|nr:hypothetical protein [Actinomycetota bacterium]
MTPSPPEFVKRRFPRHDTPVQVYGLSLFLITVPLVMALRFVASAAWSEPAAFSPFHTRFGHGIPLIVAAVACFVWSMLYTSIWAHAYLGGTAALASMFRCVETFSTLEKIGSTAYVAAVMWTTSAIVCMMTAMIGVQYASNWHGPDHPRWQSEDIDAGS